MTQEEFFAYANLDNYADNVNIWYTGSNPGTVLGLSIPTIAQVGGQSQDITAKLQQVEQITIPQPSGSPIILTITSRSQNQSPNGTGYYIFLVNQVSTQDITGPIAVGQLYFSPDIDFYQFNTSPYNVLGGSVEENRESTYIMKADKSTAGGNTVPIGYSGPANIYALISQSAEAAVIQDSNYSDTGWTNARYVGSKTDNVDYKSPPLVAGTIFQGSNYPTSVTVANIQNQISSSTVVYTDYFYAGVEDTPGFSQKPTFYETSGSSVPANSTLVWLKPSTSNTVTGSISVGDLITLGTPITANTEILRITAIGYPQGYAPGTTTIIVQRNINNVPALTNVGNPNQALYKVNPVQIYEVERNRLNGVVRGYMVVQLTGDILKLDSNGFVLGVV